MLSVASPPRFVHVHMRAPFRRGGLSVRCSTDSSQGQVNSIRVTVRKPLGLVLAERKATGEVFVEEVVPGGNAAKQGTVRAGDVVTACSATILKSGKEGLYEREGYGQRPYDNWERVMFHCRGQTFDTVMAAIGSNNERWGILDVTLELQREEGAVGEE